MSRLRVHSFAISLDGFGAGPDQDLENPLGRGGRALHDWAFQTRYFQGMFGSDQGETGVDNDFMSRGFENLGAWILGRNMFGPQRGEWSDDGWRGWWGDDPPYHCPVFVLSHYPRESISMAGGTEFHFVSGGIHEALDRAREAAAGKDVRRGGGVQTLRQYLQAGLVDFMHLAVAPVLLGAGEQLFADMDLAVHGYQVESRRSGERANHYLIEKRKQ